jgi:hypothetical protein
MSAAEEVTDTFIFCFVRMNPPTPGHLELIKTMIYKAIELNAKNAYILLSTTVNEKNPLMCEPAPGQAVDPIYKKTILEEMVATFKHQLIDEEQNPENIPKLERLNIIIECASGNLFGPIYTILTRQFAGSNKINIFFIVGRDRVDLLDSVADQLIIQDKINTVDGLILDRSGMSELLERPDILEIPLESIPTNSLSASYVRKLVKHGKREKFVQLYTPYISDPEILFDTIQPKLTDVVRDPAPLQADATPTPARIPLSKYFEGEHEPLFYTPAQKQEEIARREEQKLRKAEERARKKSKSKGGKPKYKRKTKKRRKF